VTSNLRDLATAVAGNLPGGPWKVLGIDPERDTCMVRLADSAIILVARGHRGLVRFSGHMPDLPSGLSRDDLDTGDRLYDERHSIGVDPSRGAVAVARAIETRLLPDYTAALAGWHRAVSAAMLQRYRQAATAAEHSDRARYVTEQVALWLANDGEHVAHATALAVNDLDGLRVYVMMVLRAAPDYSAAWQVRQELAENDFGRIHWADVAAELL
jgi:hypothetical protein